MRISQRVLRTLSALLLAASGLSFSSLSFAETTECREVTSLPFYIDKQGVWCLKRNLAGVSGIDIGQNNVVLDFNGFRILRTGNANAFSKGVNVNSNRSNVTVTNGAIQGFRTGIFVDNSKNIKIENMLINKSREKGIDVRGTSNINIDSNRIASTGGATGSVATHGIFVLFSDEVRIINNDISNTMASDAGSGSSDQGIYLEAESTVIDSNRITQSAGHAMQVTGETASIGVVHITNNHIINSVSTIGYGINMLDIGTAIYKDNIVTGFSTPFYSGTDAGGNFSTP